jgi:hypothetical protein
MPSQAAFFVSGSAFDLHESLLRDASVDRIRMSS